MACGSLNAVVNGTLADVSPMFVLELKATLEIQELRWMGMQWDLCNRWSNMGEGGVEGYNSREFLSVVDSENQASCP